MLDALKKFEPIYDWVYKIVMVLCKLLLVADILIMTWVVLGRYLTFLPAPGWGEETILTLMA